MRIAIIDADLVDRKKHRFPNLVCMKISGYHKQSGDTVILKSDYNDLDEYDKVYLSKVFTDTAVPEGILTLPNLNYGGTGFFYDKAPPLSTEIEHHMPDNICTTIGCQNRWPVENLVRSSATIWIIP